MSLELIALLAAKVVLAIYYVRYVTLGINRAPGPAILVEQLEQDCHTSNDIRQRTTSVQ